MFNHLSLPSLESIARDKLHGATSPGSKDNARLHRWVLLKNSLTNALSRTTDNTRSPRSPPAISKSPRDTSDTPPVEADAFLFPNGDTFANSLDNSEASQVVIRRGTKAERESEERWLDSLLESLVDDENESDTLVSVVSVGTEEEYEDSDLMSLFDLPSAEDLTSPVLLTPPESVLLPPSPPFNPVDYESPAPLHIDTYLHTSYPPSPYSADGHLYGSTPPPNAITYSSISDLCDDIDHLVLMPDAIEDSSSDTDSESLNTPFTRSTSSLMTSTTSVTESPNQLATPRPSHVRIFGEDDDVPVVANLPYRYDIQSVIPLGVVDPFQQEC